MLFSKIKINSPGLIVVCIMPFFSQAMDNPKRLLMAVSSAAIVGVAGHRYGNNISDRYRISYKLFVVDESAKERYQKMYRECLRNCMLGGVVKAGSWLTAGLLARYAFSGKVPARNWQSYAAALAFVVSRGIYEQSDALYRLNQYRPQKNAARHNQLLLAALALGGVGIYGLYKNA